MNQVGKKQDTLINAVQLNSEMYEKGNEIPLAFERKKSEMKIFSSEKEPEKNFPSMFSICTFPKF